MADPSVDVIAAIRTDKTGGASPTGCVLAQACKELCDRREYGSCAEVKDALYDLLRQAVNAQPTMATIKYVANEVALAAERRLSDATGEDVDAVCSEIGEKCSHLIKRSCDDVARIGMIVARALPGDGTIVTVSLSRTVIESFGAAKALGKRLTLCVLEGRPGGEGVATAHEAIKSGHNVLLAPDAAAYEHVRSARCVLVGADAILASGDTINKVGTATVAVCAKTCGVPVWVAAESWKYDILSRFGTRPDLARSPDVNPFGVQLSPGISLDTRMFEIVPRSYVDLLVTEMGAGSPDAVARWGSTLPISQFVQSLL